MVAFVILTIPALSEIPAWITERGFFVVRPAGRVVRKHRPFGCGGQVVTWR